MLDDQNIESMLFDEMREVNSKLISLGNNFKLVDHLYFTKNDGMIDEFIGNLQQFIKQLEIDRKKVALGKLNSDILSHVYQFLNTKTIMNCCGLVCKLWKESLTELKVKVKVDNVANFVNSSLLNRVAELKLINVKKNDASVFVTLSNSSNITRLKKLDLSYSNLDSESIKYLMKCNMPNLTELNLNSATIIEKDAIELFNSNFMSNIKKLYLLDTIKDATNSFYESIAESKYLNQITHLNIDYVKSPGDLLLKNKFNLENLSLYYCELLHCPNLLMNGNYKNLKHLTTSYCKIKIQEFVNLLVSPNLPNLETVNACYLNENVNDKAVAVFPPNSKSSLTELTLIGFNAEQFPSLFDHCPKLKILEVNPNEFDNEFLQMMKSTSLSNLERLHISQIEILEIIFSNPIYSNLKELDLGECQLNSDNVKFFKNCTNLVNLTTLNMSFVNVKGKRSLVLEEYSKSLKNNPTFSNLKHIELPDGNDRDDDDDDIEEDTDSDE